MKRLGGSGSRHGKVVGVCNFVRCGILLRVRDLVSNRPHLYEMREERHRPLEYHPSRGRGLFFAQLKMPSRPLYLPVVAAKNSQVQLA